MRLDQWLHVVRLYKTRSLALEGVRGGHVRVNGTACKPARNLQCGDVIEVRQEGLVRQFRVDGFPLHRVGAAKVPEYATDLTPPEVYEEARLRRLANLTRPQGSGRPTKRDRRALDRWRDIPSDMGT